ncbi:AraC family transcriptional regulator [Aquabacterium sp.]|uniref:AraC family transcriptional regulator n=1 Tax=Aquabacterium sp. TaxID=1872578 RepID=UPI00248716E9|nr:AraC family transcriptional regulator [Aquabacterium sp.]MDI1259514.1 AraC family transcriptional regulator ligand-binding domain-containing protein [Aquabacterium sp.]
MSFWDFRRSAASVRLLVEFGQEQGLDVSKILARSRLKEADLADPAIELDASQELCVVNNLVRACMQPGLGLEVGMRYNFASYGLWGLGLVSSATAADALALALRFIPLTFAFCQISGGLDGEMFTVTFEAPEVEPAIQRFLVERDVAAASRLMKETLGAEFALSRFALKHTLPPGAAVLANHLHVGGVRPEFGAASNSLSFDSKLLNLRLPQANSVTVAMCERACEELMERRRARLGAAECVRQYLAAVPLNMAPDLLQAARTLGLSDRTLKRRLQDEGLSYRVLLAEVRGRQAKELLADDTLSLTQIAERMGFSDLSSFSQAYKRWFGFAPSLGRKALQPCTLPI